MEIRQLKHFVTVADAKSFRRAAEILNLSQQAISKSIIQLEARIGCKLLDRENQPVRLSPHGELLIPYARSVLAEVLQFEAMVANAAEYGFGHLRLAGTPTLIDDMIPNTLPVFLQKFPNVRITIARGNFGVIHDMLLQGEVDIILSATPEGPIGNMVNFEEIGHDRNIIVVGAAHPLANADSVTPAELAACPRLSTHNYPKGEAFLAALFAEADLPIPQSAIDTASVAFNLLWLQQGEHWWAAPRRLVLRLLQAGVLVELPVSLQDAGWSQIMATRRHASRSPILLTFMQILRSLADQK